MSFKNAVADVAAKSPGGARRAAAMAWAERIAAVEEDTPLKDLLGMESNVHANVSVFCQTTRAYNALQSDELQDAAELLKRTVPDLWDIRQCGTRTVLDILQALLVAAAKATLEGFRPAAWSDDHGTQHEHDPVGRRPARQEHGGNSVPGVSGISWGRGDAVADIAGKPPGLRQAAATVWAVQIAATQDRTPLRELLGVPGSPHADVSDYCETTRAYNILHYSGLTDLDTLLSYSVPDLRALKQSGLKTTTDLLQAILVAAASCRSGDMTSESPTPALVSRTIMAHPPGGEVIRPKPAPTAWDVPRLISEWADQLSRREASIARHRLVERDRTLDDLGQDFGVTRERVRQIERNLREDLARWRMRKTPSAALLDLDHEIRRMVTVVAGEERLLDQLPELAVAIPALECLVVDLIPILLPRIARYSGWIAVKPLAALQDQTVTAVLAKGNSSIVAGIASQMEVTRLRLGLTETEWSRWLDYCGLRTFDGLVVRSGASIPEVAAALLRESGHPLSAEDIAVKLGAESIRALRNRLLDDPRIVRVAPNLFGLPEWGLESYEGIREEIIQRIDRGGGRVQVEKLVDELVNQFGVSPRSVQSYASGREFVRRRGWLYLAGDEPTAAGRPSSRHNTPAATRRCYFRDGRWWFRVDVGADALRGSGFQAPTGVMRLFQVADGAERTFNADGTAVRLSWARNQPAIGSVRPLLLALQAEHGDTLWLTPADGDRIGARLARAQSGGDLCMVAHLTGVDYSEDSEVLRKRVAEAAGFPAGKSWHALAQGLRGRGDTDVAELIEEVFPVDPGATPSFEEFLSALRGGR